MAKITENLIMKNYQLWGTIKNAWEKPVIPEDEVTAENLELFIHQTYLHIQSATDVANIVNRLGFRKKSKTGRDIKYISNDITEIIRDHQRVDTGLKIACEYILSGNTQMVDKLYN